MSRFALSLFLSLLPVSLFAAGHDISPIRYGASNAPVGPAAVAYNGNHFLSVWATSHIYGSLSGPAGGTPSPAFVAIPYASSDVLQLTSAGSGYLAIWNQDATTPSLGFLNSDGVLEQSVPLGGDKFIAPRLAFNGTNAAVVHQIGNPANAIAVSVYDLAGRLVNRITIPIPVSESYAVTSVGGDFIVVTAGGSGIKEWRVSTDGALVSTLQVQPPPAQAFLSLYNISVTAKNGRIAIAWEQLPLLTMSSAVIQPDGSVTRLELPRGDLQAAGGMTILPIDIGFFVAWNVNGSAARKVFAIRLDDAGTLLDAGSPAESGPPSVAANDAGVVSIVLSEIAPPLYAARARLYLMSELAPMPAAPRATTNDVRSVTLVSSPSATRFRVSAFSPGGLSEPVVATAGRVERRRAERR